MIVTIGTNDTLASPGAQLDYFQSVLDRMGRAGGRWLRAPVRDAADRPWTHRHEPHRGRRRTKRFLRRRYPNRCDQLGLLFDWVENGVAPGMSLTVTASETKAFRYARIRGIRATQAVRAVQRARTNARPRGRSVLTGARLHRSLGAPNRTRRWATVRAGRVSDSGGARPATHGSAMQYR